MAIGDVLYGSVASPCRSGGPGGEAPRESRRGLGGALGHPNGGVSLQRGGGTLRKNIILTFPFKGGVSEAIGKTGLSYRWGGGGGVKH